jgi:2-C-methyl-D-erythritol 2,4-cyclodiphosphate synthase
MDSRLFLREVVQRIEAEGYRVGNVDLTIVAQAPKLADHILSMRKLLSEDMRSDIRQVSVKATTTERLGFIGQEQGVAVHAVVLLERTDVN